MSKEDFMQFISTHSRDDLDKFLHEKAKPVKLVNAVIRIKKVGPK